MVGNRGPIDQETHDADPYRHNIPTAFGGGNLRLVATGNVFGGNGAGASLTTGDYNTGLGDNALNSLTVANYVTAIGNDALKDYDDTGALDGYIVAVGTWAGRALTEGSYATILGPYVCYNAVKVGEGDIYIGGYCGSHVVSTGGGNLAMMAGAMAHADGSCHGNIVMGPDAGDGLTDGDHNLFGGEFTGKNIAGGNRNTIWGNASGQGFTGASSDNVTLGNGAGPATPGVYNDTLWIDNRATDTPLIGGDPNNRRVGINTPFALSNILEVEQTSATDPIADNWTTYPSDRLHKYEFGEASGLLDNFKKLRVYRTKRKCFISDDEIYREKAHRMRNIVGHNGYKRQIGLFDVDGFISTERVRSRLMRNKSRKSKFKHESYAIMLDDSEVPQEIIVERENGANSIDLLGYIGYIHANLRELAHQIT